MLQINVARAGGKNMTLNLTMAEHDDLKPRITVFGVGGAGDGGRLGFREKHSAAHSLKLAKISLTTYITTKLYC